MRTSILSLIALTLIVACQNSTTRTVTKDTNTTQTMESLPYTITGEALGFPDDTKVYINAISFSNRPVIIDSTTIERGKFSIELPAVEQKDLNYLTFSNNQSNVLFLAENNPIQMTLYKDSLRASKIQGGRENDLFFQYANHVKTQPKQLQDLKNDIYIATKLQETNKRIALEEQERKLISDAKKMKINLIQNNPAYLTPVFVLMDMMKQKGITAKEAKRLFTGLDTSIQQTRLGKTVQQTIAASIGKIDIGSEAEDFTAATPEGKMVSLKEAMGKVTIIDFWASWCRPCRMENPHVVDLYNTYHKKGLHIIGVSLDGNKAKWIKAIADDHLTWPQISNLKQWQEPIARAYGVHSIPATFILDENGIVIAKNLRGDALTKKIAELLDDKAL